MKKLVWIFLFMFLICSNSHAQIVTGGEEVSAFESVTQGMYFDGVDDQIDFGDPSLYDGKTSFSFSYWIKLDVVEAQARHIV